MTRRYGAATALDGLSLAIHSGETVALLGANGAGKTTAVETLLGLVQPDDGQVRLFGGSPWRAVEAGRVGVMLQDAGLPEGVRVGELISLIRGLYREPSRLEEMLRLVDLADVADRQVQRLSGGQRQRVRLALAMVGHPDLVVLDEPTAALDVEARRAFWAGVDVSVAAGQTVLFATHRLEEADAVADRVIVIAHGRGVADGGGVSGTHPRGGIMSSGYVGYSWLEAKRQWRNREALVFRLVLPTAAFLILTAVGAGEATASLHCEARTRRRCA